MKDKTAVLNLFSQHGIKSEIDFHALTIAQVDVILEQAKQWGYSKPRNANGSKARYFHAYMFRKKKCETVYVVQQNYGYGHGWEDVTEEADYRNARDRKREYMKETPYPTRLITRRVPA